MKRSLLIWKLAIVRGCLYSISSLISTFLAAVVNIDFPELSTWKKFLIILAVVYGWGNTMMAFLDKTSENIAKGQQSDIETK